jgi:hypothetical protein
MLFLCNYSLYIQILIFSFFYGIFLMRRHLRRMAARQTPSCLWIDALEELHVILTTTGHRHADYVAEPMVINGIRLIVVDEAEYLNVVGFTFLCSLVVKTGCDCVLVGDALSLRMRIYATALVWCARLHHYLPGRRRKKSDV